MSRPLRVSLPGGLFHITSRGNRRENIYLDDADRREWLDIFALACARYRWQCYAWCQMSNHYHVVVESADGFLAPGMRHLNGLYTQCVNRRHRRVGHVFQGRYKAVLIDEDSYLLEAVRYVVLNPVRAGIVANAESWLWSSHRAMLGIEPTPQWLATERLLAQFAHERTRAIEVYAQFVWAGHSRSDLWANLRGQIYLGDKRFVSDVHDRAGLSTTMPEVPRAQCEPEAEPISAYARKSASRHEAMARAYLQGRHTMRAIAQHFGVHYATVSRAVRKHEQLNARCIESPVTRDPSAEQETDLHRTDDLRGRHTIGR